LRARQAEVDRLRRAQVERAREEAELAQRQYLLSRPENRLVVDNLERQWNEKLMSLAQAEEEYVRMSKSQSSALTEEDRDLIHALASDLPRVWNDPRTPARDRKRMLRLLIEDITLVKNHKIQIHIRWKAGATTSLERPLPLSTPDLVRTPAEIVELIRALATEQTDAQIARTLNARWLRTGRKHSFTRLIVRHIRSTYSIASYFQHLRSHGWLTAPEMAVQMKVHSSTAKSFAREGVLRAVRAMTAALCCSNQQPVPCLKPNPANDSEIAALILSLHSRHPTRCSMKLDPCGRDLECDTAWPPRRSARAHRGKEDSTRDRKCRG
jgi:hypothetical protein